MSGSATRMLLPSGIYRTIHALAWMHFAEMLGYYDIKVYKSRDSYFMKQDIIREFSMGNYEKYTRMSYDLALRIFDNFIKDKQMDYDWI